MKKIAIILFFGFLFINFQTFSNNILNLIKDSLTVDKAISNKKIDSNKKIKVYTFGIMEEISPPVWHKTKKAFKEAKENNCDLIIIHMNTYGGMVNIADSIRTKILVSKIPVYVFIDNNAASAGALISIACDSIYMRPGSNFGAATVVNQTGEVVADKYQSYMRSMMRSTAEVTGRDPDIAQSMVDPRIKIEGVIDSGRVLTFTASEAIKHNFCEGKAESIEEVLELANFKNYEVVEQTLSASDKMIRFLINPAISGILIMLIIGGIYFELQTPGIGFPIAASVIAALIYFAPLYLEGLAEHWEILIFVVGVILIAVEIFAIPGFGVAGILGIVFMVTGLTLSMVDNVHFDFSNFQINSIAKAFFIVIIATFLSILGSFYLSKKLFSERTIFGQLSLDTIQEKSEGYLSTDITLVNLIGKQGVAATILRPAGKVEIDDDYYDATAETSYIEKGEKIEVVKYETAQLFVRKIS